MEQYPLGIKAMDSVTGFTGTVTAKAQYLSSPGQIRLEALVDGKPVSEWFEENRICGAPENS